jgi:putative serine protease PepD
VTQSETSHLRHVWRKWWPQIGAAIVIALVAGALGAAAYKELDDQPGSCDAQLLSIQVQPSVVALVPTTGETTPVGNGVIIQADGVILTNATLLTGVKDGALSVLLADGETVAAKVIGTDPTSDVAVIKIDRTGLPAMPLSWNEALKVGEPVVAVGSPLSTQSTVASTVISTLNRNVAAPKAGGGSTTLPDLIQVNAPINDTLAGGALVTCEGQLVGLSSSIQTPPDTQIRAGDQDFGYAIAATIARRISQELLTNTKATHPWSGLGTAQVTTDAALRLHSQPGLYVQVVTANSPAAAAGLATGDLITSLNGAAATSASFSRLSLTAQVGDQLAVSYLRGGQTHQANLTLVEQPAG